MEQYINLLKKLIETPSISRQEYKTAALIFDFIKDRGVLPKLIGNNVVVFNKYFDVNKPTILLDAHHDTVKPNSGYTFDPYKATEKDGKIYGLGSNDDGASLVSLIAVFLHFNEIEKLKYNLIFSASSEEEVTGNNGLLMVLPFLPKIDFAIIGEPTQMQMAVTEKGLMVLDCTAKGKSGHAARNEAINAIYKAIDDIYWFKNYEFPKVSETLGKVKMTVSIINSGTQHNVVPDICIFTVDIRPNDCYTNHEILKIVKHNIESEVVPRSTHIKPSSIPMNHPIVKAGLAIGLTAFGSPTLSNQTWLDCPSLKIGVGDSARSHTADEYIYIQEIVDGIKIYKKILEKVIF